MAEWVCLGEARGHHFIDDSPSAEPNAEDFMCAPRRRNSPPCCYAPRSRPPCSSFAALTPPMGELPRRENRHDQSIFSLLRKTRGAVILKARPPAEGHHTPALRLPCLGARCLHTPSIPAFQRSSSPPQDDSLNPGAPIQASRCRYGREPSCWRAASPATLSACLGAHAVGPLDAAPSHMLPPSSPPAGTRRRSRRCGCGPRSTSRASRGCTVRARGWG